MASSNDDDNLRAAGGVLFFAVGLTLMLAIGVALWKLKRPAPAAQTTAVSGGPVPARGVTPAIAVAAGAAAPGVAGSAAAAAAAPAGGGVTPDLPRIVVQGDLVKFYFATGKAEMAAGSDVVLGRVVNAVKGGKTAVVSGFHDATGNAARNAELAKRRAFAVRDRLQALGVDAGRIELRKPESVPGTGSDPEARRVDVSLR